MGFPEGAVLGDPGGGRLHGLSDEAATVNAAVDFAAQQAGGFEDAQMLGNGGKRHGERPGNVFYGSFAPREAGQDGATRRVGEGAEGGVQGGGGIVNHTVYYCTDGADCQAIFGHAGTVPGGQGV